MIAEAGVVLIPVLVAAIAAIPASIAAWASLRGHREVRTSNGMTLGHTVEHLIGQVDEVRGAVKEIVTDQRDTKRAVIHHMLDHARHKTD